VSIQSHSILFQQKRNKFRTLKQTGKLYMKKYQFPFVLISILLIASQAIGQQSVPLTVEQAISTGLEKSKSLHSSLMKVEYANAKSSEMNGLMFPTIKATGSYTRLSDVPPFSATIPAGTFGSGFPPTPKSIALSQTILDNYNMRLTLQQPLFAGFKISSSANIAEYQSMASAQDYSRDKSDLIFNIKNSYWSLFKAIEFKKVIDENVQQVKAHLKDVQNFFDQGIVTKNEVLKVEVQLSNVEVLQIDAKNNVSLAMLALNNLVGLPLQTIVELTSHLQPQKAEYQDVSTLVQDALNNRPDVKGLEFRVKAGESGVTLARSGWYPQIYLAGNFIYSRPNSRILPAIDKFKDTWDVSVNASLDVWNWGASIHQTDQAQAQLAQANDGLGQLKDGITLEVTQSYLTFIQSKEKIVVAEKGVGQAEENLRVTNEKFKSGMASNSDLLDAEVALLQSKFNYIQAQVDCEIANARLIRSLGTE
jgi:outer membrane protein